MSDPSSLPPGLPIPLAIIITIAYLVVVHIQNRKEAHRG